MPSSSALSQMGQSNASSVSNEEDFEYQNKNDIKILNNSKLPSIRKLSVEEISHVAQILDFSSDF